MQIVSHLKSEHYMKININYQIKITYEKGGGKELVQSLINNTSKNQNSKLLTLIGCTDDLGGTP